MASSPVAQAEEKELPSYRQESFSAGDDDDEDEGTVQFVLEESSGYMEPSLHFLAVAHTAVSFFCIIGYYCLKVPPLPRLLNGADMLSILEEQSKQTLQRQSIIRASTGRCRW